MRGAQAFFVAGLFVFLSLPVSLYGVAMHLEYLYRPKLQLRIIRILWMVPIYALDRWPFENPWCTVHFLILQAQSWPRLVSAAAMCGSCPVRRWNGGDLQCDRDSMLVMDSHHQK